MVNIPTEERKLNEEQQSAVRHGEGPLLIIAGAGTGKTTVVTERIKYLITSKKAQPQEILALSFTEKASREMEERVDVALPYGTTQLWISTFHAFCDRLLRTHAIHIGLDPNFTLMTEASSIMFFRKHLFDFSLQYFRPLGNPNKFISGMIQHFSRLKDEDITPTEYIAWGKSQIPNSKSQTNSKSKLKNSEENILDQEKYVELANAYQLYEELKAKEGMMDYGDLISNALKLFRTRKNILKEHQEQFKYLLIDEFQDTNFAQNELAILLAGKRKNITVVGDDDQAIYRWRGAAVSNILQFRKHFPKTKIVVLTKNYRSTQEILDRSHELVSHNNPDRLEVVENIDKKLESLRRLRGDKIEVIYAERVEDEAEAVAKEVKRQKEKGKSDGGQYEWKDYAILVRANNHAEPFARALSRQGIPYQFLGPGKLFRQPEVKDLIAYLHVLQNFEDNIAMYRVLSMDIFGISGRDIAAIINEARKHGVSVFETCEALEKNALVGVSDDGRAQIISLVQMLHRHLDLMKKETAGYILYSFLETTGLLKKLVSYKSAKEEDIAQNIARFFSKIKTYEVDHEDASVFAVVDWLDLSLSLGESPAANDSDWAQIDGVNIMTIHASKGLEFPVVFLTNLVGARFPSMERKEQIPLPDALIKETLSNGDYHMQEERRLFYVGMTRARDQLYFTAAKYYGEGKREKKLSPFIAEAIGELELSAVSVQQSAGSQQLSFLDFEKKEMPEEKKILRPVSYLSYSQISTFETCPLQYRYRYILKIPVPASSALVFGDIIHKTMQAFYEQVISGEKPSIEQLLSLLDAHWTPRGFGHKGYEEKLKVQGQALLRGFFEKGYEPGRVPKSLEEPFRIHITPTLTIGGKIDRIDELGGGKIEIIDYKTGQAPKGRDVKRDMQLSVYALAAREAGTHTRKPEDVIVSFYFFDGQEKVSATRTQEQLDGVKEKVAEVAHAIAVSDFRPTPGKHCEFCEFRLICEAWN